MKKVLKWAAIIFCGMGLIAYTSMIFTEDPAIRPAFIVGDLVMALFLFLLLRKKRPKAVPTYTISSNLTPDRAIQSMKISFTVEQGKDQLRILHDCLNLIEKTKNLDTFFGRYEFGMQAALTLDMAQKAGVIQNTENLPAVFFKAVESQKTRVLSESFLDQHSKIDKLSTNKAKITHWKRYLDTLSKYEDQYSLEHGTEYHDVIDQVLNEISKLEDYAEGR